MIDEMKCEECKIDITELTEKASKLLSRVIGPIEVPEGVKHWDMLGKNLYKTDDVMDDEAADMLITPCLCDAWQAIKGKQPNDLPTYALVEIAALIRYVAEQYPDPNWQRPVTVQRQD